MPKPSHIERFWTYVNKSDGCWNWTGRTANKGRAYFQANRRRFIAARWLYEHFNGPIAKGICVLHSCDNILCVRIKHLYLGTQQENIKDRDRKRRGWQVNKTHCPRGHEYNKENTRLFGPNKKYRACRKCSVLFSAAYRLKLKKGESYVGYIEKASANS